MILVNCWRRELPTYLGERTRLETLDPSYAERVCNAGGFPLLLSRPPAARDEAASRLVAMADGVLLSGGGDVEPGRYGAGAENVQDEDVDADAFELAIIDAAREAQLPVLGICRGAQLLAVAHGGRLSQRLSTEDGHAELAGLSPDEILSARHPITLTAGSRVARALGRAEAFVNTIHHHQIADPGELVVTATAPGGAIEAVETPTPWPCVGVQWHPEKMNEPEQRGLFDQLVNEARLARRRAAA